MKKILEELLPQVITLVRQAAELALQSPLEVFTKGENDFVTSADLLISKFMMKHLPPFLVGAQVLSEEALPPRIVPDQPLWVVDPIDGTTNFMYGLPSYCISVGLYWGQKPVLGVVYCPVLDELYTALKGAGAFLNGKPIQVNQDKTLSETLLLAETNPYGNRKSSKTSEVIARLFLHIIDYRVTGSAALDLCLLAAGRAGMFITEQITAWDCAAELVILTEAGGTAMRWDSSPMDLQTGSILATNTKLQQPAMALLRRAMGDVIGC